MVQIICSLNNLDHSILYIFTKITLHCDKSLLVKTVINNPRPTRNHKQNNLLCYTIPMKTPKVLTDENLIDKFLNRGVENIFPTKDELKKKLMSGQRLRAYQGFDPTGPYLHVGHAMGIRGLRILQQLGHEVIFLIGDFTARVGDPDKDSTRKLLTLDEVEKNANGWKKQAAQLINFAGDNPVQFKHNYEWLSALKLEQLIELMSKATVQQMIERDMFQRRIKENNPIGVQEFIYPLMQGYDSVAMNVDLEIGGTDQIFNMLVGRSLCKSYLNKEKFIRANILMEAPDARTMSKTKGNGINLSDSAEDMYGKAMSYADEFIIKGLTLLTDMEISEISEIEKNIEAGENPMTYKKQMAYEIVKTIKGGNDAKKGQIHFENTVQNKNSPDELPEMTLSGKRTILSIAVDISELSSSDLKRIIKQGGFEVDGTKYIDPAQEIELKSGQVIKLGKRNFVKAK